MKIFISHSHNDKKIVDRLAHKLINSGFYVWIDKYELEPNQSLRTTINKALEECSHFCFILSKSSISSEWCLEELKVAIDKEFKESRVFIYPIIIEDCKIPDVIIDRLNFDFRDSFEKGFEKLLFVLNKERDLSQGSFYDGLYKRDYAIDWGTLEFGPYGTGYMMEITSVSFEPNKNYSILAQITFIGKEDAVDFFETCEETSERDQLNRIIIELTYNEVIKRPREFILVLKDGKKVRYTSEVYWKEENIIFTQIIEARILGELPDTDVHFDYGSIIEAIKYNK